MKRKRHLKKWVKDLIKYIIFILLIICILYLYMLRIEQINKQETQTRYKNNYYQFKGVE